MNCQQKSRFSLFPRAFKNRDPKSYKKSSLGGQNEPQELLRRSQEQPKRPQDGPKRRQERPKRRQDGPKSSKKFGSVLQKLWVGAPRPPRGAQDAPRALREALGAHFGVILGVPGPMSTRKLRGFAPWDLQKSRLGRGLSSKNAAKPMDFTFCPIHTSYFTRRNGNAWKIKLLGSVAGLGALAPLEIRPLSLLKAQEGAVSEAT